MKLRSSRHRWEALIFVVIVGAAFALRIHDVARLPMGLHGDEAATGLEGRRILESGWIGVWTGAAAGNPTGTYYLAAIALWLTNDPVFAVRALLAVSGTVAVAMLYLLVRRSTNAHTAVVAAVLLTCSDWHLQFSRAALVTGMWPTCLLFGAWALLEAGRAMTWSWWALSGAAMSLGLYFYNGHGPLLIITSLFVVGWLVWKRRGARTTLLSLGCYFGASLIVLWPMIMFIRSKPDEYFGRGRDLSVANTPGWQELSGIAARGRFLVVRYWTFWDRLTFHPRPDGADLSGISAPVPRLMLGMCMVGLLIALAKRRSPLVVLSTAIIFLVPITPVLTDLTLRRSLAILPFLCAVGATGVTEISAFAIRRRAGIGVGAASALGVIISVICWQNLSGYFQTTVRSELARHTFAVDLRDAAEFMKTLPSDSHFYFFAERWTIEHEVVRFLVPRAKGDNKLPKWGGDGSLVDVPLGTHTVLMFFGSEEARIAEAQRSHPGGTTVFGPRHGDVVSDHLGNGDLINAPSFVAYLVNEEPI